MQIKTLNEEDLKIKEDYVLGCFKSYLYHKRASDVIQEELSRIAAELSSGAVSTGIIKVSKNPGRSSPRENELLAREHELIKEQDRHEEALAIVDGWVDGIKNPEHRRIVVEYLIKNRHSSTEEVAKKCCTTKGNVSNVTNRVIKNIAKKIFLK